MNQPAVDTQLCWATLALMEYLRYFVGMKRSQEMQGRLRNRYPSRSAQSSRRAELERIMRMSAVDRVALALALGRRRTYLIQMRNNQTGRIPTVDDNT